MLQKQTISISNDQLIDEKTIATLKRGDRYKLFKLDIRVDVKDEIRLEIFYRMLDEMPEFEISWIKLKNGNNDLINTLTTKPMFKNKQDLFDILEFDSINLPQQSESYEYLSKINNPEDFDMS